MSAWFVLVAGALPAAVPTPWTPVEVAGGVVSVWGRQYVFASNALPVAVTSAGRDLLASPMRIVCMDASGSPVVWGKGGSWLQEKAADAVTFCAWQEAPQAVVDAVVRIEFDGMMKVTLVLAPGPEKKARKPSSIWLEIPLLPSAATLYAISPVSCGGVKGTMILPFRSSVWLGNESVGLCWFCESDASLHPAKESRALEILPGAAETVLRVRLSDVPPELPATWTFGIQATPVKPWSRAWNAQRVLHAPQMGAGSYVKRPEVWWTAQRAFPDGNVAEALDSAKASGVTMIMFHEDWVPVQNNPTPQPDFKAIVDACHARGIKVAVYQGYELSPLDPLWEKYHETGLLHTAAGKPMGHWFREPGQRDYRVCYRSSFAEEWFDRVAKAYGALELDGLYLDGTVVPRGCANMRHGCGWRDSHGALHVTYPFFAVRSLMRRLYEFVQARGGVLDVHQSGYVCPATLAFAHSYWDGEQLVDGNVDIKRALDLAAFRAEFMGRNHGVSCEFLAYEKPGAWSYEDALALALPHDVLVRPCGFAALPRFAPVWKALDGFGFTQAEWTPYWEHPVAVTPSCAKASVYRKGGESLIVVSNLSPEGAAKVEVSLPPGAMRVTDVLADRDVRIVAGKVTLELPSFRMALLRVAGAK